MTDCVLGIDVGTSGTKASIVRPDGKVVGSTHVDYEGNMICPRAGWAEEDANIWWQSVQEVVKSVLKRSRITADDIRGVAVSGLCPNIVPIDRRGKPLRNAIIWADMRAEAELAWVKQTIGDEKCFQVCGNVLRDPYWGGLKLLWLKNNWKSFDRTWKFLEANSYITFNLTDEPVTDYVNGSQHAPFFDIRKMNWSDELVESAGISTSILPTLAQSEEVCGEVTQKAASATGLKAGTPVMAGTADYAASQLSVGVIDHGEACFHYGTSMNFQLALGEVPAKPSPGLFSVASVPGTYMITASCFGGGSVKWFRNALGNRTQRGSSDQFLESYEELDELAGNAPPGCEGLIFLPFLLPPTGPVNDPKTTGAIFGLTPAHSKGHMFRALLEGTSYYFRWIREAFEQATDLSIEKAVAVNGGGKSRLWRQILSDITGMTQLYAKGPLGAPLGDAVIAAVGCGLLKDFNVTKTWVQIGDITEPSKNSHVIYGNYELFKKLYSDLIPAYQILSRN